MSWAGHFLASSIILETRHTYALRERSRFRHLYFRAGFLIGALVSDGTKATLFHKGHFKGYKETFYNTSEVFLGEFKAAATKLGLKPWEVPLIVRRVNASSPLIYMLYHRFNEYILTAG